MTRSLREFYFTIDLRSLAAYRILLGVILISDWLARWPDLEAFYTNFGVLPAGAGLPRSGGGFYFSLLDGATELPMVRAAFGVGLLFYVLFLLGYRTRLFQWLTFIFFVSVQNRNPIVRNGGDFVMMTMLMWSLFLPMGKRFSLDAFIDQMRHRTEDVAHPPRNERSVPSFAAFAIIAQIGLIYYLSALDKSGETWKDGTALYYALNIDQFVTPLSKWLVSRPLLVTKLLTWGTLAAEFIALPLIIAPLAQPYLRRCAMAMLATLHIGIALTMKLGDFPFVMIATYALLMLPEDWRFLEARLRPLSIYFDHKCRRFAARETGRASVQTIETSETARSRTSKLLLRTGRVASTALALLVFAIILLKTYNLNVAGRFGLTPVSEPRWARGLVASSFIGHQWDMFAPDPLKDDGWWVIVGQTESGEMMDPLTGRAPTFEKPENLSARFDRFWRKYLYRIWQKSYSDYRPYFGDYVTRKNHRDAPLGQRLWWFDFYYVEEKTQPPGFPQPWPTTPILLWHQDCLEDEKKPVN